MIIAWKHKYWVVCSTPYALSPDVLSPRALSPRTFSHCALSPHDICPRTLSTDGLIVNVLSCKKFLSKSGLLDE